MNTYLVLAVVAVGAWLIIRRFIGGKAEMSIVKQKIEAGATVVDVRSPEEFRDGGYPGAINIPLNVLAARLHELPKDKPVVLDVRTLGEWERGHLAGAIHMTVDDVRFDHGALPKGRRILVYCRSGFRAHLAVRALKQLGHADVANVTGGWVSMLAEDGLPLVGVVPEGGARAVAKSAKVPEVAA